MPRVMPPQRGWDRLQWVTGVILSPPLGRKMQVYHNEEATGGTEPPMGLLETGQAVQGQALCAQEPRPQELSGNTRGGLEAQERRRFSASELMTRLHSSLRLGRSTAPRALTSGSGAGVIREGTSYPPGSEGGQGTVYQPMLTSSGEQRGAPCCSLDRPTPALAFCRETAREGTPKSRDEDGQCVPASTRRSK